MVKSLFAGRRKSQGNAMIDDGDAFAHPAHSTHTHETTQSTDAGSGGFRVMTSAEANARKVEEKRRALEKPSSKFRPFSGFGNGNKSRNHSVDDESPASSKRDSKSSSGTGGSRPYNNGQFGSTSTLPSSADTGSDDNIFAALPRPPVPHQHSSPSALSMTSAQKQLPTVPRYGEPGSPDMGFGRVRAMTSSSYASTAKPPTLDADLDFGSSSFDNMFGGLDRKESPPDASSAAPGRSLLNNKRGFQAEPLKIDRKSELEIEPPLASWESRGSADNLMSPSLDRDSPPTPPAHTFSQSRQYAPVASYSPELNGSNGFSHVTSYMAASPDRENSPGRRSNSRSAPPIQTPISSQSGSSKNNTPKAVTKPAPLAESEDDDYENIFAPSNTKPPVAKKASPAETRHPQPATDDSGRRIMTQAEFRAQQQRVTQAPAESDSEEEDYEDEEEAAERATQEAIARRKKQQMDLARETMRRTTTAPAHPNRPDSITEPFTMGFPSEISSKADEWEDEDVPLGILAQHGFPSKVRQPSQPVNVLPSYFRNSTAPTLPERPQSAGPMGGNRSSAFRPAFARNLPEDPHASFIGGGLIQPTNRESLGFSRGPGSVVGESPMMFPEPQLSAPSLVEQIHMRDMTKQKYMGGASAKKTVGGPFTGAMGAQMNPSVQNPARMPAMPGMQAMNPMMNMNMNMMGSPNGMPMMGMNGMAYPMSQQDMMQQMAQMQQMQQMFAQQMQLQQMQAFGQPSPQMPGQDPRMSMMQQDPRMSMMNFGNNSFLGMPGSQVGQQRPMSMMSAFPNQQPQARQQPPPNPALMSGGLAPPPPIPGYTPSIAPSERSTVGLSARYRPVATNNDNHSTVSSSMTLQASVGGAQTNGNGAAKTPKSILKKQTAAPQDDEDEGWGKMAARKSKFLGLSGKKKASTDDLRDIVKGIDAL